MHHVPKKAWCAYSPKCCNKVCWCCDVLCFLVIFSVAVMLPLSTGDCQLLVLSGNRLCLTKFGLNERKFCFHGWTIEQQSESGHAYNAAVDHSGRSWMYVFAGNLSFLPNLSERSR